MSPPTTQPADEASLIKPMAVWLVIQLAATAIGCFGVPLSAKRMNPPESLSIQVMAVVQTGAGALLWPMLMRSWGSSLAVLFAALPFFQTAAFLSATPPSETLGAGAVVLVWLFTLAVLPRASTATPLILWTRLIVIAWCIGGAGMAYLAAEFSSPMNTALAGPIVQILSALHGESMSRTFIIDGILLGVVVLTRVMTRINRSKRFDAI